MTETLTKTKEQIDIEYLLFLHLDRMSNDLGDGYGIMKTNADKLLTRRMLTKHTETILVSDLYEKEYWEKLEELHEKEPPVNYIWGGIPENIQYFDWLNDWLQLLLIMARKKGYLGHRIRFKPEIDVI